MYSNFMNWKLILQALISIKILEITEIKKALNSKKRLRILRSSI